MTSITKPSDSQPAPLPTRSKPLDADRLAFKENLDQTLQRYQDRASNASTSAEATQAPAPQTQDAQPGSPTKHTNHDDQNGWPEAYAAVPFNSPQNNPALSIAAEGDIEPETATLAAATYPIAAMAASKQSAATYTHLSSHALDKQKGQQRASTATLAADSPKLTPTPPNALAAMQTESKGLEAAYPPRNAHPVSLVAAHDGSGEPLIHGPGAGLSRTDPSMLKIHSTVPVGQRAWADDIANRVIWLSNRHESRAELVLSPPALGKLNISLQQNGDQLTAYFVAASQTAREVLEQALPKLREALQQAGVTLGEANVGDSSEQNAQRQHDKADATPWHRISPRTVMSAAGEAPLTTAQWSQAGRYLVDIYA